MYSPFSAHVIAREFPVEKLPDIVRKNGSISRSAIACRLSSVGCPHGNVDVAVAVLKTGGTQTEALHLAMLASYYSDKNGPSMDCLERMCNGIQRAAEQKNAQMHPTGKSAEDLAARREGRESRWGTADFHRAAQQGRDNSTKYYPYRAA